MSHRKLLAVALAAVLALAACSGDDDDSGSSESPNSSTPAASGLASEIRAANEAEESLAVEGTVVRGDRSAPFSGRYQAEPFAGATDIGVFLPGGETVSVEVRFVEDVMYIERYEVDAAVLESTELSVLDRVALRRAEDVIWLQRAASAARLASAPALYGPYPLLEFVAVGGLTLDDQGADTVGDVDVTHYVVEPHATFELYGLETLEFWVDDDLLLRRVRATTATEVTDYEVTEFGLDVAVDVPPADDTTTEGIASTGSTPAGELAEVAAGDSGGVAWRLLSAPSSSGGTCWAFVTTPPVEEIAAEPACGAPAPEGVAPEFTVEFPVATDGTTDPSVLVAVTPLGLSEATFGFTDGTTAPAVFVDPSGIAVWVGPGEPAPGVLELVLGDGTEIVCAPGSVTDAGDLAGLDEETLAEMLTFPWTCVAVE